MEPVAATRPDKVEEISPDNLMALLEFEINSLRAKEAQYGWTPWALRGSLATVLWLLASELQTGVMVWIEVALMFVFLSILLDSLSMLSDLSSPRASGASERARFRMAHLDMPHYRLKTIAQISRALFVLVISANVPAIASDPSYYSVFGFYGFMALALSMVLIMSFSRFPFPVNRPGKGPRSFAVVMSLSAIAVGFFSVWRIGLLIRAHHLVGSMHDWKVAGLITISSLLSVLIAKDPEASPLLSSLIEIRRGFGLGELSLEGARKQTEIALAGMQLSDLLQDDLRLVLASNEKVISNADAALRAIESLELLGNIPPAELTPDKRILAGVASDSVRSHIDQANQAVKDTEGLFEKFAKRLNFYQRVNPQSAKDAVSTIGNVRSAVEESKARIGAIAPRLKQVEKIMDSKGDRK